MVCGLQGWQRGRKSDRGEASKRMAAMQVADSNRAATKPIVPPLAWSGWQASTSEKRRPKRRRQPALRHSSGPNQARTWRSLKAAPAAAAVSASAVPSAAASSAAAVAAAGGCSGCCSSSAVTVCIEGARPAAASCCRCRLESLSGRGSTSVLRTLCACASSNVSPPAPPAEERRGRAGGESDPRGAGFSEVREAADSTATTLTLNKR